MKKSEESFEVKDKKEGESKDYWKSDEKLLRVFFFLREQQVMDLASGSFMEMLRQSFYGPRGLIRKRFLEGQGSSQETTFWKGNKVKRLRYATAHYDYKKKFMEEYYDRKNPVLKLLSYQ